MTAQEARTSIGYSGWASRKVLDAALALSPEDRALIDAACTLKRMTAIREGIAGESELLRALVLSLGPTAVLLAGTQEEAEEIADGIGTDLVTVFRTAMETEWAIYWASHKEEHHCHGKTVRKSFLLGMIKRLNARLSALIEAAKSGPALSEAREIIVLKAEIVEKAFRDLDLRLKKSYQTTRAYFDSRAYDAGQLAGEKVSITSGALDCSR